VAEDVLVALVRLDEAETTGVPVMVMVMVMIVV
jgi:hypothetical protein